MAKRMTDCSKWDKPWFRKLNPLQKCFWHYICDRCDCAGVWQVDLETATYFIGEKITIEKVRDIFDKQCLPVSNGSKWVIRDFIRFQYGDMNEKHTIYKPVLKILTEIGMSLDTLSIPYQYPIDRVKEKEEEKETNKDIIHMDTLRVETNTIVSIVSDLNSVLKTSYKPTGKKTCDLIRARLNDGFTLENFKTVHRKKQAEWGSDPKMSKFLRPETLYGNKFEGYLNQQEGINYGTDDKNERRRQLESIGTNV